jgi:putative chitinase
MMTSFQQDNSCRYLDVHRSGGASAIRRAFEVATGRAGTLQHLGDNLDGVQNTLSQWHGEGGEAFHADLGKVRADIDADGYESTQVATAVAQSEEDIRQCKAKLDDIEETAHANHWTITPDWRIDIGDTGAGRGHDLQFITAWQMLQADLDQLKVRVHAADHELANAIRAAVGEPPLDTNGPAPQGPAPQQPGPLTVAKLREIVPELSEQRAEEIVGPLNDAMREGGMDTPQRQAAFISQVAVESDRFKTFEEYADGSEYEGRTDLGNTQPGDGPRYKGRGAIQVTGRYNYTKMSQDLGVDFVNHPELAATPQYAFKTALWYWNTHNGNAVADQGNIVRITEMVNGGHHGLAERTEYYNRGLQVLGR